MNPVRARVVPVTDARLLAWLVGLGGGLWSIAYLGLHEWRGLFLSLGISRWWGAAIVLATWIGGTRLTWRRRPRLASVRVEGGVLQAGPITLEIDGAITACVARAARGTSVAIARNGHGAFFEVESEADARRLLAMIGVPWPGRGTPELFVPNEGMRRVQRAAATLGLLSAIGYGIAVGGMGAGTLKGVFGFPALGLGALSTILFVCEPAFRRSLRPGSRLEHILGRTRVDAHARLHDMSNTTRDEPVAPLAEQPARARALATADESIRAWLERIDAIGRGSEGYRGDAPTADELLSILESASAATSARLAAARLLALRHGKGEDEIRVRLADEALAPRVRIVIAPDPGDVAEELEAAPPVFELETRRPLL